MGLLRDLSSSLVSCSSSGTEGSDGDCVYMGAYQDGPDQWEDWVCDWSNNWLWDCLCKKEEDGGEAKAPLWLNRD